MCNPVPLTVPVLRVVTIAGEQRNVRVCPECGVPVLTDRVQD